MRTRLILGTDLKPSVICMGTADLGGKIDRATSFGLLDTYMSAGGNFIDTANVYADWLGGEKSTSEKTIGAWMRERGNRGQIVLATKGGHPRLETMHISRLSPEDITFDVEQSLSHLGTDYIDLYWLHRDDPARPAGEIMETLNRLKQEGKIRAFGCSNWRIGRIEEARRHAEEYGLSGFCASQPLWNLAELNREAVADPTLVPMDEETRRYHEASGMAAVPYSSQANGFFSGRYARDRQPDGTGSARTVSLHYFNETSFDWLERTTRLAAEKGVSGNQIALAYLLAQPFPVFPIIGGTKPEYVQDSCGAADVLLTQQQAQWLEIG